MLLYVELFAGEDVMKSEGWMCSQEQYKGEETNESLKNEYKNEM